MSERIKTIDSQRSAHEKHDVRNRPKTYFFGHRDTLVPEVYFYYFHCEGERKINLWLKAAIDSSSRANQFELRSDPDSVS
jgi:hypothetical protein